MTSSIVKSEDNSSYINDDELADKSKTVNTDDSISDSDQNRTILSNLVPPVITISKSDISLDSVTITGEIIHDTSYSNNRLFIGGPHRDQSHTNLAFENMSVSNFKFIRGVNYSFNRSNNTINFIREGSVNSPIQMKKVQSELSVQTGEHFLKTSTFLISRKESNLSFEEDDLLEIKIVDKPNIPELFIEFDSLHFNLSTNRYCWVERSRWLKFEENYNSNTGRFDSPHLSPISINGITNFQRLFSKGEVFLDCHQDKFINVLNNISDAIIKAGTFSAKEMTDIRNALVLKHYHAGETLRKMGSETSMYTYDPESQCFQPHSTIPALNKRNTRVSGTIENSQKVVSHLKLDRKLNPGTESLSVQVGALKSLEHTFSLFVRLDPPIKVHGLNEVSCPLRFIFIIFGPISKEDELLEVGRVFSVMMSNPEYREVGYSAKSKDDFIVAIDGLMNNSVLVPLNKVITHDSLAAMLPQMKRYYNYFITNQNKKLYDHLQKITDIETENTVETDVNVLKRRMTANSRNLFPGQKSEISHDEDKHSQSKCFVFKQVLKRCCTPFRYFYYDWIGLKLRYLSDFEDAFKKNNAPIVFIGILFIYFVVMVPAITFGSLLNAANPSMTLTMMLIASGFFQLFYTLFGGQPMEIIGITGPVFAVEMVLSSLSLHISIGLGPMRLWIAIYLAFFGIIFTAFNGVIIIQYIRISVEEIYSFLVAAIYFLSALFYMFKAVPQSRISIVVNQTTFEMLDKERFRFGVGGVNLFLAFLMTNFCLLMVEVKNGSFFSRTVRNLLGSLNVPIGILIIIAMEKIFFNSYDLPKLNIPAGNLLNMSLWFNVPSINSITDISPQIHVLFAAISISLFAILTCEVSTNSITSTKSERKLVKPSLYSLNYFYIMVLFPLMSGLLGWPFVSGAPVRSQSHCMAMSIWSVNLPGIPSKVIGAVEQRVSGVLVGALAMLTMFLGTILQHIPMAAMYGMFLYMGIKGAVELIFIRRLICLLQHRKYWHEHDYLKDYPTWHIVTLVLIQICFVTILIVLNCIAVFTALTWTPLLFPVIILIFAFVRGYVLPRWEKLNAHLPRMDKKHPIRLYADLHTVEQFLVTVERDGSVMKVLHSRTVSVAEENCDSSSEVEDA